MRKRLWLQFHLWTIGLVALLTVINVATVLRPYSKAQTAVSPALFIGNNTLRISGRSPASNSDAEAIAADSRLALKTARIGCEPATRLRIVSAVRQLRLQFEPCSVKDTVSGVQNKTNGFDATVFNSAVSAAEPEAMAGIFTTPEASAKAAAKAAKKDRTIAAEAVVAKEKISTDYISLSPGENEITIRRAGREQILKIERK